MFHFCFLLAAAQATLTLSLDVAFTSADTPSDSLAAAVELSDEGLNTISALHNEKEMALFIRRLLNNGARVVIDPRGLKTVAKRYSATGSHVMALKDLKEELAHAWWVGEGQGKTATLNDGGFEAVAGLKNEVQMRAFLRRVVSAMGREVNNNAVIDTLAEQLAGVNAKNRFHDLRNLLRDPRFTSQGTHNEKVLAADLPLTEVGYQRLAMQRDNEQMKVFVKRILASEGRSVKDEGLLSGFVPYFSGVVGSRDLNSLRAELRQPRNLVWIDAGIGRKALLNENGFNQVAQAKDGSQMKAFIRRLINPNGRMPISEGALSGMVPFFSGEKSSQPYSELLKSIADAKSDAMWDAASKFAPDSTDED